MCHLPVVGGKLVQLFLYRLRLAPRPDFQSRYPEIIAVVERSQRWRKRLRVLGEAHCPNHGPAIFAGNHLKLDDPFIMFRAIHMGSGENIFPRAMMRDDFFQPGILTSRLVDLDELLELLGAMQINREHVQLSQLRPFLKLLRDGGAFLMYPGRSRTRSGLFTEYNERFTEPGAVSFFVAQAQRGANGVDVPVVPMARTFNPVTKGSAICFGEPLRLPANAGREEQRALDYALMERMGELVELNAAQITAALLYLHALHGRGDAVNRTAVEEAIARVTSNVPARRVDPALFVDLAGELDRSLRFFEKRRMLRRQGDSVRLNHDAILTAPLACARYRKANPLKYLANEILHLSDVTARLDEFAL